MVNLIPSEAKTESYFSPDCFIRRITQVLRSGIYLSFTAAIVTETGSHNRIKNREIAILDQI